MSYPEAFRSAVFWFLACTPCAQIRSDRKARQKAKRDREEKIRQQQEQPDLYHHPLPHHTNTYWTEEIQLGPALPKKAASKNGSQRRLTSSGVDSTVSSLSGTTQINRRSTGGTENVSMTDDDWNKRRHQRRDEELWGHPYPGHRLVDASVKALSSAGRKLEAKLGIEKPITSDDRYNFYVPPRNPPVNDYHPPVVSIMPAHKDAHTWMLQPPPPAKFMEGKIPEGRAPGRTRVESVSSCRLGQSEEISGGRGTWKSYSVSESELIESVIGAATARTGTRQARSRRESFESGSTSDGEIQQRRRLHVRSVEVISGVDSGDERLDSLNSPYRCRLHTMKKTAG